MATNFFSSSKLKDKRLFSLDTEFIDLGSELHLISIGMVREDGAELYLENADFLAAHEDKLDDWMDANVMAKTFLRLAPDDPRIVSLEEMRRQIANFVLIDDRKPSIWAHYAAHDWVAFSSIWGKMLSMPEGMGMFVMDFRAMQEITGIKPPTQDKENAHHALIDARWGKRAFAALGLPFAKFDRQRDLLLPEPQPAPAPGPQF